jgi:hypothetical protein
MPGLELSESRLERLPARVPSRPFSIGVPWWYVDAGTIGAFNGPAGVRAGRPLITANVSGWSDSLFIRRRSMSGQKTLWSPSVR